VDRLFELPNLSGRPPTEHSKSKRRATPFPNALMQRASKNWLPASSRRDSGPSSCTRTGGEQVRGYSRGTSPQSGGTEGFICFSSDVNSHNTSLVCDRSCTQRRRSRCQERDLFRQRIRSAIKLYGRARVSLGPQSRCGFALDNDSEYGNRWLRTCGLR
jgi:hypothetical protein